MNKNIEFESINAIEEEVENTPYDDLALELATVTSVDLVDDVHNILALFDGKDPAEKMKLCAEMQAIVAMICQKVNEE